MDFWKFASLFCFLTTFWCCTETLLAVKERSSRRLFWLLPLLLGAVAVKSYLESFIIKPYETDVMRTARFWHGIAQPLRLWATLTAFNLLWLRRIERKNVKNVFMLSASGIGLACLAVLIFHVRRMHWIPLWLFG